MIVIEPWHLWSVAGCILLAALATWLVRRARRPKAASADAAALMVWVANQLKELNDDQAEAVRLWAWADRQGWNIPALNVKLGNDFPRAKEALKS